MDQFSRSLTVYRWSLMIKVNLISKKQRAYKGRNWTKTIVFVLFGLVGLYFIGVTLYVVISMSTLNAKTKKVKEESVAISSEMLKNNEKLSRFVLTKLILTKIQEINKERFRYKDYLDQMSSLLPGGSELSSVAFAKKGWISLTVSSESVNSFSQLEDSLMNNNYWLASKFFSGAFVESVVKDKTGGYSTKLQLELKK